MHEDILTTRCKESKKNLEQKYGKEEIITKAEWINKMNKELQRLKEVPKAKIQFNSLRTTLKVPIGKHEAMMVSIDTGLKNSLPCIIDWLVK